MCCFGCQAVAQAIVGNGLADYYPYPRCHAGRFVALAARAVPAILDGLVLYDHADFQKSFVRLGEHEREASLIIEGITCAACIWLNERHVAQQPGVIGIEINFGTHRARALG